MSIREETYIEEDDEKWRVIGLSGPFPSLSNAVQIRTLFIIISKFCPMNKSTGVDAFVITTRRYIKLNYQHIQICLEHA